MKKKIGLSVFTFQHEHNEKESIELAKEMDDLDAICQKLQEYSGKIEASFLVDKLDYLVKGGRCSSAAALGANLLGLKPCIEVKGGKMGVVKKYRGSFAKCLASYVKDRLADRDDIIRDELFLTYTTITDDALAAVKAGIEEHGHFSTVYETTAGCTVSCHCGPSTLGVLFVRK